MTWADVFNIIALPCSLVLTAGVSWVSIHGAAYLREKTHNEQLARLVDGAGRIANDISDHLKELPPGSDLVAVKAQMIQTGVADARATFNTTIANLGGAPDAALEKLIRAGFTAPTAPVVTIPAGALTVGPVLLAPPPAATPGVA